MIQTPTLVFAPSPKTAKLEFVLAAAVVVIGSALSFLFGGNPWLFGVAISVLLGAIIGVHGFNAYRWSRYAYQFYADRFHVTGGGLNEDISYPQIANAELVIKQDRRGAQTRTLIIALRDGRSFKLVDQVFIAGRSKTLLADIHALLHTPKPAARPAAAQRPAQRPAPRPPA